MSLRYKILAAVTAVTVCALFLALMVVILELFETKTEYEAFDRDLRQRIVKGVQNNPREIHVDDSPLIQHEFIRDIVHVDGADARGRPSFVKAGEDVDQEEMRALVRRAIQEDRIVAVADAFAMPDSRAGNRPAEGGTYFSLDIPDFSPHEPLQKVYVVFLIGVVAVIIVIYVILSRAVIRPIERLEKAAKRVAQGDYSRPVPPAGRNDEIDTLIETFNAMMLEVGSYRQNLEVQTLDAREQAKAAEKNLVIAQRLAATGKLASGIAHEVNNPLAGMLNAARRLLKEPRPSLEKHDEYMDLITDGLLRVQQTVKKILQFTPHKVAPQPVEIATVLRRALALASHRIEKDGTDVVVDLPAEARVFGDPFELQQVFLNLLINALDSIAESGNHGEIVIRGTAGKGQLKLVLKDNGIGLRTEDISRVFDLFFTTKEVGEGTGLGLSIAHNVIQNHGGSLRLSGAPGEGAEVEILLPLLNGGE